jgi:Transcription elongation factor, GreA/GreB, C-term
MSTPTVTVGATVSVQNEETGEARTWTIVGEDASRETGEISPASAVAQALLGHAVGDTVEVAATRPTRYTITGIVPAPEPAKPAVQPRPLPAAEILVFRAGQDDEYEEWVRRHPSGYVVKKADRAADGYILHHAECHNLDLDGKDYTLRTASPRHCCSSLQVLENWCSESTGSPPRRCGSCFS